MYRTGPFVRTSSSCCYLLNGLPSACERVYFTVDRRSSDASSSIVNGYHAPVGRAVTSMVVWNDTQSCRRRWTHDDRACRRSGSSRPLYALAVTAPKGRGRPEPTETFVVHSHPCRTVYIQSLLYCQEALIQLLSPLRRRTEQRRRAEQSRPITV